MLSEKFEACLLAGAIGDAWGSSFENEPTAPAATTFYLGGKPAPVRRWAITDDTQLTLATCEALAAGPFDPTRLGQQFVAYYQQGRLTGLGASTLQAIRNAEAGIHWTQTSRRGQYAAGNGAAMRIAPFAFYPATTRHTIYDACRLTHQNEDAYAGALAVYLAIRAALRHTWTGRNNLLALLLPDLPDTNLTDRLRELSSYPPDATIAEAARLGNNGHVVNSVPFALFCATKIRSLGLARLLQQLIATGGDTDTNASLAGQVAGALMGPSGLPPELLQRLAQLPEYPWITEIIERTKRTVL
ncbi:ADP-ribosylglycohydrolase family protein [Hymenobacter yonginensis]|uniref:ADP-ribosylglycohydrolase family protein n=1 Tax=Hymenobacter yonginensis TaxID=748197 RepID=A0ABY7PUF7_9BACT|nr:ADP-ribosylglycohydrolase family protein [Hymenobacter yonginensis]WBO86448.1 ADP-ribosylglycohydrolase family protein [Hymenobacter yonginensis]